MVGGGNPDGSESMTAVKVLKILDNCIKCFSKFLEEDNVKSMRKFGTSDLDGISPLEDVNYLGFLDFLVQEVQKVRFALDFLLQSFVADI